MRENGRFLHEDVQNSEALNYDKKNRICIKMQKNKKAIALRIMTKKKDMDDRNGAR